MKNWIKNIFSKEKSAETKTGKDEKIVSRPADWQPDGIYINEGLQRFGNKLASYLRIMNLFCQGLPELIEKVKEPTEDNLADYAVSIHGLRGSCLGISANLCAEKAMELELAAKAGNFDEVCEKNVEFLKLLEKTASEIREFIAIKEKEV